MKTLSVKDIDKKLKQDKGFKIIDVREPWEHEIGKIDGSIEMPLSKIVQEYPALDKSLKYGVICHSGVRSLQGGSFLESKGFSVVNVGGGIDRWSLEVDNNIERY
jgi:adenylyltransferase/sulfurtransferase